MVFMLQVTGHITIQHPYLDKKSVLEGKRGSTDYKLFSSVKTFKARALLNLKIGGRIISAYSMLLHKSYNIH